MPSELRVGGLARLSSCDWPGELVATVFCQGCGWRCAYCHNADLQPACEGSIAWSEIHAFLASRVGLLDSVVFSGGEPLLQSSLIAAVTEVRALGFKVGLHTSGAVPSRLAAVLPDIDWVGFDIKAPFVDYPRITGAPSSGADAEMALRDLLASGKPREIRTTVHPRLISGDALIRLGHDLVAFGITSWVLQPYRAYPGASLNPESYDAAVVAALNDLALTLIWR